jgi:hypothetical protein
VFGREPPKIILIYKWYKLLNQIANIYEKKNPWRQSITESQVDEV